MLELEKLEGKKQEAKRPLPFTSCLSQQDICRFSNLTQIRAKLIKLHYTFQQTSQSALSVVEQSVVHALGVAHRWGD
jgi:hypothetical protein